MRRLAIFSFAFALAALCAGYLPLDEALIPLGIALAVLSALTWIPLEGQRRARKAVRWAAAGLALGFLWTAGYSALFWRPALALDDTTIRLQGTVAQWPQETGYGFSVQVRLEPESGPDIRTLLYLDDQGADLRPGDKIETVAHCSRADRSASGEEITYYTAQGVFLTARAYGRLDVERPESPPIRDWPACWTRVLEESVERIFPQGVAPLAKALVTPDGPVRLLQHRPPAHRPHPHGGGVRLPSGASGGAAVPPAGRQPACWAAAGGGPLWCSSPCPSCLP